MKMTKKKEMKQTQLAFCNTNGNRLKEERANKTQLKDLTVHNQRKKIHNDFIEDIRQPKTVIDSGHILRQEKTNGKEIHQEESSKVVAESHRPMEKRRSKGNR